MENRPEPSKSPNATAEKTPPGHTPTSLTEGPVGRTLLRMTLPVSLGMLSTFLFQIIDTLFVGWLGGDALAALAFAGTTYFLALALFMGFAVGVSAAVGAALGAGDPWRARRLAGTALAMALVSSASVSLLLTLTIAPTFRALGASDALLPLIDAYLAVLYPALPLLVMALVGGSVLRAAGHAGSPEIVMGLAGAVNLVLDYLLIFGKAGFPELGFAGAAWATAGSWLFAGVGTLGLLLRAGLLFRQSEQSEELHHATPQESRLRHLRKDAAELLRLGAPAVATQVLLPLAGMFLTVLLARSGPAVVAAFGVAQRIESLGLVGISAASVAIVPVVAQNLGAGKRERIRSLIAVGGRLATYWGVSVAVLLWIFGGTLVRYFTEEAAIVSVAVDYFRFVGVSYATYGLVVMGAASLGGMGKTNDALKVLSVKSFVLLAPLAALGASQGANGVFLAISVSNVLAALFAGRVVHRAERQLGGAPNVAGDYAQDWSQLFRWLRRG